jgi:hypothetical protein
VVHAAVQCAVNEVVNKPFQSLPYTGRMIVGAVVESGETMIHNCIMSGMNRTATDRGGVLVHAVDYDGDPTDLHVKAVCGAAPGKRSNGWSGWHAPAVTCPKCLAKLAQLAELAADQVAQA